MGRRVAARAERSGAELRWRSPVVLALALWVAMCSGWASACSRVSPAEAEAVVARAVELIDRLGLQAALLHFMDRDGEYRSGELYVFVLDRRGALYTGVQRPAMDVMNTRDAKGRYFVKEMLRVARRRGHGWVSYEWPDPCTGRLAEKQTFVKRAGDYVVAAGIYSATRI